MKVILGIIVSLFTISINSFGEIAPPDKLTTVSYGDYIPVDLNDCFVQLDKIISDSSKANIALMSEDQFSAAEHMELGLWMRNNWGLWKRSRLSKYFKSKGINHPDDMSGIILTSYHRYLTKKDIKLDEQIKYYQDYWEQSKKRMSERDKKAS